jgi:ribosomal protein L32
MAVPKKRTSKSVTNTRKSVWKGQAKKASQKSLSLAKSILKKKNTSFIYKETGIVTSATEVDQEKE